MNSLVIGLIIMAIPYLFLIIVGIIFLRDPLGVLTSVVKGICWFLPWCNSAVNGDWQWPTLPSWWSSKTQTPPPPPPPTPFSDDTQMYLDATGDVVEEKPLTLWQHFWQIDPNEKDGGRRRKRFSYGKKRLRRRK
jgi:hypothetical protein